MLWDECRGAFAKDKTNALSKLYTQGSHHWNIRIIHIVQNCFADKLRTARINTHYITLMRNPSDQLQICTLARQIMPRSQKRFIDAYNDATSKPYSYLFLDMNPETEDTFRLRANIFPGEEHTIYAPPDVMDHYYK